MTKQKNSYGFEKAKRKRSPPTVRRVAPAKAGVMFGADIEELFGKSDDTISRRFDPMLAFSQTGKLPKEYDRACAEALALMIAKNARRAPDDQLRWEDDPLCPEKFKKPSIARLMAANAVPSVADEPIENVYARVASSLSAEELDTYFDEAGALGPAASERNRDRRRLLEWASEEKLARAAAYFDN